MWEAKKGKEGGDERKQMVTFRASDISRKKKQNFAGFSGANSR